MAGTALVEIAGNQWNVEVANTSDELLQGLSGRASLTAGTGMLFILPVRQVATIQTNEMLFPLDIIFIINDTVFSIARNIQPGFLVEEATPCDGFLEINALEAALVEVGDIVTTVSIQEPPSGFDFSSIIGFVIPLAILGFVSGMFGKGSNKKKNNPGKDFPVHCVSCGWTGHRTHGPLKSCPKCGGVVVWTFSGKTKPKRLGKPVTIAAINAAVKKKGWKERLTRGEGYFYWYGGDAAGFYESGVYVFNLNDLTITEWLQDLAEKKKKYSTEELPERESGEYSNPEQPSSFPPYKGLVWKSETHRWIQPYLPHAGEKVYEGPLGELSVGDWVKFDFGMEKHKGFIIGKGYKSGDVWVNVPGKAFAGPQLLTVEYHNVRPSEELPERGSGHHSISGKPREKLVDKYGSWAVGRAEAVCPEDDVKCVTREAERLFNTIQSRYGEGGMEYVNILSAGGTVFHYGDVVSIVALEKENRRVRALGEREATYK